MISCVMRKWVCTILLVSCTGHLDEPLVDERAQTLERSEPAVFVYRDVVVVLSAGTSEGRDCIRSDALWSCNFDDEGWNAQVQGLAEAVRELQPNAGRTRISVVVNTLGQQRSVAGREILEGPRIASVDGVPLFRVPLDSPSRRDELANLILQIDLPRVEHLPPARNQCPTGWPQNGGRCTPGAVSSWGVHAAAQLLRLPELPEESTRTGLTRREVCLARTRQDAFLLPNGGTNIVAFTPTFPAEAFSPQLAWLTSSNVVDRLSVVGAQRLEDFRRPTETSALLSIDGEQLVDGTANFTVRGSTLGGGAFEVSGSTELPAGTVPDSRPSNELPNDAQHDAASRLARGIRDSLASTTPPLRVGAGPGRLALSYTRSSVTPIDVEIAATGGLRFELVPFTNTWSGAIQDWGSVVFRTGGSQPLVRTHIENADNEWKRGFTACLVPSVRLRAMEVTQSIQNWRQRVPLIQGKRTFVRVFFDLGDLHDNTAASTELPRLQPRLRVCRGSSGACPNPSDSDSRELSPVPFGETPLDGQAIAPVLDSEARSRAGVVFELPAEFTVGKTRLELMDERLAIQCAEPAEFQSFTLARDCSVEVEFTDPLADAAPDRALELIPITPVLIKRTDGSGFELRGSPTDFQREFLERHLPLAFHETRDGDETVLIRPSATQNNFRSLDARTAVPTPTATDETERIAQDLLFWRDLLVRVRNTFVRDHCTRDNPVGCERGVHLGLVNIPPDPNRRIFGLGKAGAAVAMQAGVVQLHEIFHALGRHHTPYCMPRQVFTCPDIDGDFDPYPYTVTFGAGDPATWPNAGLRPALGAGGAEAPVHDQVWGYSPAAIFAPDSTWDIMSYCLGDGALLPSLHQVERLIASHTGTLNGVSVEVGRTFASYLETPWETTWRPACGATNPEPGPFMEALLLVGDEIDGDITLAPIEISEGPVTLLPPDTTALDVRLESSEGDVLLEAGVPTADADAIGLGEIPDVTTFEFYLPYVDEAAKVVFSRGGADLLSIEATDASPTVTIPSVTVDEIARSIEIEWESFDSDGDSVSATVELSVDDGATYQLIGDRVPDEQLVYPLDQVPATPFARVRVNVSDGFLSASAVSSPFVVPVKPPLLLIDEPAPGAVFSAEFRVSARARDVDFDRDLPLDSIRWLSNIDGPVHESATGVVDASRLTPGAHTLSATATNSTGLIGTAEVSLIVEARASTPDLEIRTTGPSKLVAGVASSYRFLILNNAPVAATNAVVEYEKPAGARIETIGSPEWSCAARSAGARCEYIGSPIGMQDSVELPFVLMGTGELPRNESATHRAIISTSAENDLSNNRTTQRLNVTNLAVEIQSPVALPGAVATHLLSVANVGSVEESAPIRLAHTFPVGVHPVSYSAPGSWDCELLAPTILCTWTGANLGPGESLPSIQADVRISLGVSESRVVFHEEGPAAPPAVGAIAEYRTVAANEGSAIHNSPILYTRVLPPEVEITEAAGDGWECNVLGQSTTCIRNEPLAPSETTSPVVILGVGQPPSELVTIIDPPEPVVPGIEQIVVVRVRNEGAGVHRENVTLDVAFEPGQDVRGASGDGWSCRVEGLRVYCSYLAGFLEPGNELPPVLIPVVLEPADPTDVELVVESTAPVRDGDLLRYSITMTNNGPGDARGPFAIDEELLGPFASASGEGWACMSASGQLQCTNATARLASTTSLPPISVAVLAEEPPLPPAPDGVRVVRYLVTNFVSVFPDLIGTASFDVVPIGATGTEGPFEVSGVQSNFRIGRVSGDGWGCTTETLDGVQELTCRHPGDGLLPGQLPPRITVHRSL